MSSKRQRGRIRFHLRGRLQVAQSMFINPSFWGQNKFSNVLTRTQSNRAILHRLNSKEIIWFSQLSVKWLCYCLATKHLYFVIFRTCSIRHGNRRQRAFDNTKGNLSLVSTTHCFVSFPWIRMFKNEFKTISSEGSTITVIISRRDNFV